MKSEEKKNEIRWQLADINNRLNKLLKEAIVVGPRHSTDINNRIHELRELRSQLEYRIQVIDV